MATLQRPPDAEKSDLNVKGSYSQRRRRKIKNSRRQRAASMSAKHHKPNIFLPERLLTSGAVSMATSIGLGLYGLERDSGTTMLASGGAMLLGVALSGGALARYLSKSHRGKP